MNIVTFYLFHVICSNEVNAEKNKEVKKFEKDTVPSLLEGNGFNLDDPKHKNKKLIDKCYATCGKNLILSELKIAQYMSLSVKNGV